MWKLSFRRRWEMWKLSFRRRDHGRVECYEFDEATASDHGDGGTNNSRRNSADESCATDTSVTATTSTPVS